MRIIFMGTPEFAVPALLKLVESEHEVVAVFTQEPKARGRGMKITASPVGQVAEKFGIKIYTPKSLKSSAILDLVQSLKADIIVVAAYGFIIPPAILQVPKYGCINIHPSLLPKYRGAAPLQRTIINGDKETAICIMQMDVGLDTGDIILQKLIPLSDTITLPELHDECAKIGAELLLKTLDNIATLPRIAQSTKGVSYAEKLTKSESRVNWQESAYKIACRARGMNPWPGLYFTYEDKDIKILAATYDSNNAGVNPGTVVSNDIVLSIACKEGVLHITKLQQSGKKPLDVADFLRGMPIKVGTVLKT